MKAIRYFLCVAFPPLAVLLTGRFVSLIFSLLLTPIGWLPGVVHAILVVNDYEESKRAKKLWS